MDFSGVSQLMQYVCRLYLDQRAHVGKVSVHSSSVWKVLIHSLHELGETAEGHGLCEERESE